MPVQNALTPVAESTTDRTESSVRSERQSPESSSHITLSNAWYFSGRSSQTHTTASRCSARSVSNELRSVDIAANRTGRRCPPLELGTERGHRCPQRVPSPGTSAEHGGAAGAGLGHDVG